MKVMSIFGTRPEMIKLWSTLRLLDSSNFEHIMVHTGQNHTPELKDFFFRDLNIRTPDYQLQIDTTSYAKEVADVILKTDELMEQVKPDALLILGDTYSGLSVMPATQRGIKTFHMEAGLRAWDVRMPEQRNRILLDHMCKILLPFNNYHRENLIRENIHPSRIYLTGNPTFEVMRHFQQQIDESTILETLSLEPNEYYLVTAHRSENVDNPQNLSAIFEALKLLAQKHKKRVIYPMHPRTASKVINPPKEIEIMKPFGFYDFNKLFKHSICVLSDSGTASEEGYFYKVPCISIRMNSERPETIEGGAHIITGLRPENILESVETATLQPWSGRYNLELDFSPASVVVNCIRSEITNFF